MSTENYEGQASMIAKETDQKILGNKFQRSGSRAEEQMSYYLKRAFGNDEYTYVINDLRLELEGDYAQIDHLIIHRFGFIILESKSVTSKVCINKQGEWKRIFNNDESGMPSPIQQARRQAEFLQKFLTRKSSDELYRESLANKLTTPKIEKFHYDILVAISDDGIIERNDIELSEIYKADTITDSIQEIISTYYSQFVGLLSIKIPKQFHQDTVKKISTLLVASHYPAKNSQEVPINSKEKNIKKESSSIHKISTQPTNENSSKTSTYHCTKCQSDNLQIVYGKYGYYFKCLSCGGNNSIKLKCFKSICKPKLKKEKLNFYKVCQDCNVKELFFTNK